MVGFLAQARACRALLLPMVLAFAFAGGCSREPSVSSMPFPGASGSAQPRLTTGPAGLPVLSWLEREDGMHSLRYARVTADGVGEIRDVISSERMFINWADFPSVTAITDQFWFAHWLRKREEGYAYDIATLISTDGGQSWADAEQMNEDSTEAEHGFVSVFPWDDQAAAVWLDGRELADWSFDEPDALLGVSLRLARYDRDGTVLEREIVDEMVCDCCQPDTAITAAGPVVIYRDRTEQEIRDIKLRRYQDGGWSEPVEVGEEGWQIDGCPVNGPVIAAQEQDVVAAWFTAANSRSRVRFARSADAGGSFADAIDLETRGAIGQPGIVLDEDGKAVVSWWRRDADGGSELMLRAVDRNDVMSEPLRVARESIGQAIDVPQLVALDDSYLVAWTTLDGDGNVRLALVDIH